jgi:CubicO group peptidase (beta-lactamase class C family)
VTSFQFNSTVSGLGRDLFFRLILVFLSLCAGAFGQDMNAIQSYIRSQTQAGFMGSILIARGGQVLLEWGVGLQNVESQTPNSPATKFRIASLTKQFTAVSIMQLQEAGKLHVEDRACQYIEGCPDAWKDITIYQLLTHESGIYDPWWLPESYTPAFMRVPLEPLPLLMVTRDIPLNFSPGTSFSYSNSNFIFLGAIVEKLSGMKYADYLQKHILDPLGMNNTGYDITTTVLTDRASGYNNGPSGMYNSDYIDMSLGFSAWGLYSTVGDLYRWDRALYTDVLLTRRSRDAMFAPSVANPAYGFGWDLATWGGHKENGHVGDVNGFLSCIARFPDDDATIIVLSNNENEDSYLVAQDLAAMLFGGKPANFPVANAFRSRSPSDSAVSRLFSPYEKRLYPSR